MKEREIAGLSGEFEVVGEEVKGERILIEGGIVCMEVMVGGRGEGYDRNGIGGYDKEVIGETFGWDKEGYVGVMVV
ncbi:hypothetical protein [Bacillus sp. WP8]|uniref:hypothetical protein n=1 Tax=Bacillus sp. WP8 TaxID=756828 RepID=UPI0011AAD7FC|nr:hypothetical protein [Bacillus sp. WP8]